MKILITGIHGFVGINLVAALNQHVIYGLDIVSPRKEVVLKTFNWNELDSIPPVDVIIHLAGKAHDTKNQTNAQVYFDINTGLTQKIYDWFLSSEASKFIFFSSVKAAADKVVGEILTEEIVPSPKGPYGESKIKAENYIISRLSVESSNESVESSNESVVNSNNQYQDNNESIDSSLKARGSSNESVVNSNNQYEDNNESVDSSLKARDSSNESVININNQGQQPTTESLLSTTHYPLLTHNSQLPTTHYPLTTTNSQLPTTHYPLATTHYRLPTTDYKKTYILRPCMIHGPGNKGNLNLLYQVVKKGIPYPLGAFENRRSFTSIDNLSFVIEQLIEKNIPTGIYNVGDDETLSTNELIALMADSMHKPNRTWNWNKSLIQLAAKIGTVLHLPLNTERLQKLTENYVVSNAKIKHALGVDKMPVRAEEGFRKTIESFGR